MIKWVSSYRVGISRPFGYDQVSICSLLGGSQGGSFWQRLLGLLDMIAGTCSSEWDSLQIVAGVESSTLRPHQISVRGLVGGILRGELSSNAYARVSRTKSSELRAHQISVGG